MQMDPARVEDIQQALIKAGDLQGTPSGRWDAQTREAMAHYQTDNGFGVTGLPDAKSLMKLGLGPHPLPPQLDKTGTPASEPATGDAGSLPANPARDAPARAAADPTGAVAPGAADPPMKR
jgi:peptidoglycan hydrolase-like protein with peptidoglycan-binding domain